MCAAQHQEVSTVPFLLKDTLRSSTGMCNGSTRVFIVQISVHSLVEFVFDFIRSLYQRSYRDGGSLGVGLKYNPKKSFVNFEYIF